MYDVSINRGANLENVQEMNRALVIRQLRKMQICSRADLAKATGLKQSTITNIINDFILWGLVHETGIIEGGKGRRSIGLKLNGNILRVIGVRLARAFISVGLFDVDGTEYAVKQTAVDVRNNPDLMFRTMKEMIYELLKSSDRKLIAGIAVATPGPLLRENGRNYLMADFLKWEPVFLQEELQGEFGLPIYVEHHAKAAALAEWWFGGERQLQGTMVCVLIGQGVGAGIIINGNIYRGSVGFAGEIGHISIDYNGIECECGNVGCLEKYSSVKTVMSDIRKALEEGKSSVLTNKFAFEDVLIALQANDAIAVQAFEKAARCLGIGLVNVINTINPDRIVLGDELTKAGDFLLDRVKATLSKYALPGAFEKLSVKISTFQQDPVLIGAAALIIDDILKRPASFIKV